MTWAVIYPQAVNIHEKKADAEAEIEKCRKILRKIRGQEKPISQPHLLEAFHVAPIKKGRKP